MKKIKTVCGECIKSNYLFNDFVDDLFELKANNISFSFLILLDFSSNNSSTNH